MSNLKQNRTQNKNIINVTLIILLSQISRISDISSFFTKYVRLNNIVTIVTKLSLSDTLSTISKYRLHLFHYLIFSSIRISRISSKYIIILYSIIYQDRKQYHISHSYHGLFQIYRSFPHLLSTGISSWSL